MSYIMQKSRRNCPGGGSVREYVRGLCPGGISGSRNINSCSVQYKFTVSDFLRGIVDGNIVVRQYCSRPNTATEDRIEHVILCVI